MAIEVKVPDIGDFKDVPVIEIHVKVGDTIKADDPLISLESDKATMDVPASQDGTVEAILVKIGDKVSEGTPVLTLKAAAGDAPVTPPPSVIAQQEPTPAPKPTSAPPAQPARAAASADAGLVHASPSVRRLARELEVDLAKVKGTGEKGRVTKDDVKAFLRGPAAAPAAAAAAPVGRDGHSRDPGPGLLQVRPDRDQADGAHQAHLRPVPAPRLAQHPARHPRRRGGHHRARRLPQAARRCRQGRQEEPVPGLAAAVPDEGQRLGAARLPRVQQLAVAREGQPDLQEILQCRDRRRHAGRSRRARGQGRRPQGHRRAEP